MFGNVPLILPLGVLPILLIIGFVLYLKLRDTSQERVGSKFRKGLDEFPSEIAALWTMGRIDDPVYVNDGTAIAFTLKPLNGPLTDGEDVREEFRRFNKDNLIHGKVDLMNDWPEHCLVSNIQPGPESGLYTVTVSLDDDWIKSERYVQQEVRQVGHVLMCNATTNKARYLGHKPDDNELIRTGDGRVRVNIPRRQYVQGFLDDQKEIVMSRQQIIRNLQNRLWNRVEVRCVKMDSDTFHGEIVGL